MHDTPKRPVEKTIGSVSFTDDYDWLQRDTPEALEWMWARDAEAQAAALSWPGHAALLEDITARRANNGGATNTPPRLLAGRWFHAGPGSKSAMPTLWVSPSASEPGAVVVEAADLAGPNDDPQTTNMIWFEPSPNGELVACGVASAGAMVGHWRVVEVASGRVLDFSIPCTAYSGALPGWLPDASGFYLAERLEDGRHCIRFHPIKPGTPPRAERSFDAAEIAPDISGLTIEVSPDGSRAIALTGPHERIALMLGDLRRGEWCQFLPPDHEGECQGAWLGNDTYVARVHDEDCPRGRVVSIPTATSRDAATWHELLPGSRAILKAATVLQGHVVLAEVLECAVRFRTLCLDDGIERILPLDSFGSSLIAMIFRRFDRSEALTFDYGNFVQTTSAYHFDLPTGALHQIGNPPVRTDGIRVTQHFARSIDGVRVPYFLVHRADLDLSKPNPALITGYGGFNVALMPYPLGHLMPFVEAGGVYIHCNLRGGGEYGKQWHESGRLACKWNVFADLFAIAEQVIAEGITQPEMFAMTGGSNGGLLAGAAIAHRPDLWRAVVPVAPILDQMETLPREPQFDAMRAILLGDYGSPDDPVMSKVLYSYSPYHNIRPGTAYPAVYQVFGEKDIACMPFNGRKFTAALRACTTSDHPVHLRVWKDAGHSSGSAAEAAEWLGFIMQQLGMAYPASHPA